MLLTDGSKGGWLDGLGGIKALQPHFGVWGACVCPSFKGGAPTGTCGVSRGGVRGGCMRANVRRGEEPSSTLAPPLRSMEGAAGGGGDFSLSLIELPLINRLICRSRYLQLEPPHSKRYILTLRLWHCGNELTQLQCHGSVAEMLSAGPHHTCWCFWSPSVFLLAQLHTKGGGGGSPTYMFGTDGNFRANLINLRWQ